MQGEKKEKLPARRGCAEIAGFSRVAASSQECA
jgi:hypothetical protein